MSDDPFAAEGNLSPAGEICVTLKGSLGNDPWVVLRSSEETWLADKLGALTVGGFFATLSEADKALKAQFTVNQVLGGTPVASQGYAAPSAAPAASAGAPPGVAAPTCPHGTKNYVPAGVSKASGKPYSPFWGCPAPQGDPSKCRPEWVK